MVSIGQSDGGASPRGPIARAEVGRDPDSRAVADGPALRAAGAPPRYPPGRAESGGRQRADRRRARPLLPAAFPERLRRWGEPLAAATRQRAGARRSEEHT